MRVHVSSLSAWLAATLVWVSDWNSLEFISLPAPSLSLVCSEHLSRIKKYIYKPTPKLKLVMYWYSECLFMSFRSKPNLMTCWVIVQKVRSDDRISFRPKELLAPVETVNTKKWLITGHTCMFSLRVCCWEWLSPRGVLLNSQHERNLRSLGLTLACVWEGQSRLGLDVAFGAYSV